MIFDSHAHYDDKKFDGIRDDILNEIFKSVEIKNIMNIGVNIESSAESIKLSEEYPQIYSSVGIHPHDAGKITDDDEAIAALKNFCKHEKVKAIGEIGLDYYYDIENKDITIQWFHKQMRLASELGLPVIVHNRDATGPCLEIVKNYPNVTGIFHSFSGSIETALELIKRNWYISFSGVVTFKNAARILDVVKDVPLNRLLVETDCPYLAPHPMRGKINHSGYLKYTIEKIAELKNTPYDELCAVTYENARKIYNIQKDQGDIKK